MKTIRIKRIQSNGLTLQNIRGCRVFYYVYLNGEFVTSNDTFVFNVDEIGAYQHMCEKYKVVT